MRALPPPPPDEPGGVYVHVPFCASRCSYCDFPTVAGRDDRVEAYVDAVRREIATGQPEAPAEVDSVYLGGGTPSRLPPKRFRDILRAVHERFDVAPAAEVTLEANPEDLDDARLAAFREAGATRLSLGVQSLDDVVLRAAGRGHGGAEALAAVERARRAGFERVSVDLIAGLPGERLERWGRSVRRAAEAGPDHVSVYLLETDKDSPLGRSIRAGRARAPDDDALAEAYAATVETLAESGFPAYEISNFAPPGARGRHNLKYWRDVPYAAFGLGAHAYFAGARRANRRDLGGYLADLAAGRDPAASVDAWDPIRRVEEALFLGLRVVDGVDLGTLGARYGVDLLRAYGEVWERAIDAGLLRIEGDRATLTAEGRVRSNEVFAEIVGGFRAPETEEHA